MSDIAGLRFVQCETYNECPTFFHTEEGGFLHFGRGEIQYGFAMAMKPRRPEAETDAISSYTRVADKNGVVWEMEAILTPYTLIEGMLNINNSGPVQFFENVSDDWRDCFATDLLVAEAEELLDDRFYRTILIRGKHYIIPFKYQGPKVDVAFYRDTHMSSLTSLLIRVSGLYGYIGSTDGDYDEIPPIVFEYNHNNLAFRNYGYFDEEAQLWLENSIPLQVMFHRTVLKDNPQDTIEYAMDVVR